MCKLNDSISLLTLDYEQSFIFGKVKKCQQKKKKIDVCAPRGTLGVILIVRLTPMFSSSAQTSIFFALIFFCFFLFFTRTTDFAEKEELIVVFTDVHVFVK